MLLFYWLKNIRLLKISSAEFFQVSQIKRSIKAILNAYPNPQEMFTDVFKWHIYSFKSLKKVQWNSLTSATFVYDLGIMYDAVSELCDLSKHLKERHNIARSLFYSVKADSGLCINGWQSSIFCWRRCQSFSELALLTKFTAHNKMS